MRKGKVIRNDDNVYYNDNIMIKAGLALGISIIADALDYVMAPVFSLPVIGDVFDAAITGILFSITKSKVSSAINMIEFIPIVGDLLPVYTISTLIWILRERKGKFKF